MHESSKNELEGAVGPSVEYEPDGEQKELRLADILEKLDIIKVI